MPGTYRALVPLLGLTACRLHFSDQSPAVDASDGPSADAGPLSLACNMSTVLVPGASGNRVSAVVAGDRLVAAFLDASGGVGAFAVTFVNDTDILARRLDFSSLGSGWSTISVASDGTTLLVAAGSIASGSRIGTITSDLAAPTALTSSPIVITTAHSLLATGRATDPEFAIAGSNGANSQMHGVAKDSSLLGATVGLGTNDDQIYLVKLDGRIATVNSIAANRCGIASVDDQVTARGAAATWGTDGQCTQATAAHIAGRTDLLIVRHDTVDGDLNDVIGAITGTTFLVGGESLLRNPAAGPHPLGASDRYWVSYQTGTDVEVVSVDTAGTVGTRHLLGNVNDATAHDLAIHNDTPIVVWLGSDGFQLARACP